MICYNNLSAFTEVHLGNTNITEVYYGDVKKWPSGPQPFGGKFKLTLNDSTVIIKECNSSSTVTQAEVSAYKETVVTAEIGNCVTSLGVMSFFICSGLTSVILPNSLTTIGTDAFSGCYNLTGVTIPDGVTSIGQYAFEGCRSFTDITIPDSVVTIGGQAFRYCPSLTSVTIGSSVISIGQSAFVNCASLQSITIEATTPPTLGNDAFKNTNNCPIYVPTASVETYKSAWSTYASRIQAMS